METIKKPWGQEEILESNEFYTVKRLTMENGHRCSLQYHEQKMETIYVQYGILTIDFDDDKPLTVHQSEFVTINPGQFHRMEAKYGRVVYLECSTSQLNDVIRINDDYNRA